MEPDVFRLLFYIMGTIASAAFAAGGAYLAVKVKLEYMERAIVENKAAINALRLETKQDLAVVHDRLSRVNDRMRANGSAR